jgi:HK97 family phage major capsid protein
MSFDPFTASVEAINEHIAAASTETLMRDMREVDARANGDLAGSASVFYHRAHDKVLTALNDLARAGSAEDGTPFGRGGTSKPWQARGETYNRAMRTTDAAVRRGDLPDYAAERVESLLTTGLPVERNMAGRWAVSAGDPLYASAFAKMLADPDRGHLEWTAEEGAAYRRANAVQAEMRAMSTTTTAGGFLVPFHLDPALILTSDGSVNPLRRLARTVQISTGEWHGVSSAGVSAEWVAEATEVTEETPTVAQPPVPVHKADVMVKYSIELGQDAVDLVGQVRTLMSDAADQLQATAFTTGSGDDQPTGIVTALAGTASEINTTGTEAIVAADAYALQNALPPRWQPNAQWTMGLPTINTFRQFETSNGALMFPELRGSQPHLLGRRVHENSNMDSVLNVAATENNYVAIYGDHSKFLIVDRIGASVDFLPVMLGANRLPTGERGLVMWLRTGSDVLVNGALRMLDVPTTA